MIHTHRLELFACRASENFARQVINHINLLQSPDEPELHLGQLEITPFSDGEFQPQYEESVRGASVYIIQSTIPPADNLMELLLAIDAAKRASADEVVAVMPYFGWARQDRKDRPRVAIGAKLVANLVLVGIGDVLVPVRAGDELRPAVADLKVQVREIGVEPVGHAVLDVGAGEIGIRVLVREVVDVAEGEVRTKLEDYRGRALQDLELDQDLVAVLRQHQTLAEHDLAHLVGDLGHRVRAEVHHVFVAARFIGISVAVNAKVELLAADHQTLVQVGQQKEAVTAETVERHGQETVVSARVAGDDGRVAVGSRLVGAQDLALERVG